MQSDYGVAKRIEAYFKKESHKTDEVLIRFTLQYHHNGCAFGQTSMRSLETCNTVCTVANTN